MLHKIIKSWARTCDVINSNEEILKWVEERNNLMSVKIKLNKLSDSSYWYFDKTSGNITNHNSSFFQIKGLQVKNKGDIVAEQPIIIQDEIGYLGIICKEINGILYFLMQAKIEPGNINKIQISPTIQATKSNFTQQHGGKRPAYLEYFINTEKHSVVVDQIQSEQSSRFYKKRNRNIIIEVNCEVEVLVSHKWMTLGQIKQLMRIDNLVNMDTRTVLSCIPFSLSEECDEDFSFYFTDKSLCRSVFEKNVMQELRIIYSYINNYKMFDDRETEIVPLTMLQNWVMTDDGISCKDDSSFRVIYCNIEVEGREVEKWTQPLFKAEGIAVFGLVTTVMQGIRKFLVRAIPEIGSFDKIEVGPTVQQEVIQTCKKNKIETLFFAKLEEKHNVLYDVYLSEEGGRFYHEQNRNVILEVPFEELKEIPEDYFLVNYSTLNVMLQFNNCVNIQLRNLLSLLEV